MNRAERERLECNDSPKGRSGGDDQAGPTGFVLARRLIQLKVDCIVMAPSKTERKPNEKVKTDKLDAKKIARLFCNGDVTEVRIPPALDEAVRDLCRARTDSSDDLSRAKQRLKSFLLRNGIRYEGKSSWTPSHMNYLRHLTLPDPTQALVLEGYLQTIDACVERVASFEDKMKQVLTDWEWRPIVEAVMACKGFKEVAAMTFVSEVGDLRRFKSPRQLMAFLGLVPGEESTGNKRHQGSITKCGNGHARWMLCESAQAYRREPKISAQLSQRQHGQPQEVKALSWRMQKRLSKRYRRLRARGIRDSKCIVAIARELCGFLWELQVKLNLPIPTAAP
ncbi:IS110 family transposase [Akkermansiaceae bacterium]|nr:IS110 family transposase [Akkermansiaceae bacterium]